MKPFTSVLLAGFLAAAATLSFGQSAEAEVNVNNINNFERSGELYARGYYNYHKPYKKTHYRRYYKKPHYYKPYYKKPHYYKPYYKKPHYRTYRRGYHYRPRYQRVYHPNYYHRRY